MQLSFTMQEQKTFVWCWAAVGASCALFYDPLSIWTQCKLVEASIMAGPGSCCQKPVPLTCLVFGYLQNPQGKGAFILTGIANGYRSGALSFSNLKAQLDAGLLVAFRVSRSVMNKEIAHFVVVSGYDIVDGQEYITVNDPFFNTSFMSYQRFQDAYKLLFKVSHSFLTKK